MVDVGAQIEAQPDVESTPAERRNALEHLENARDLSHEDPELVQEYVDKKIDLLVKKRMSGPELISAVQSLHRKMGNAEMVGDEAQAWEFEFNNLNNQKREVAEAKAEELGVDIEDPRVKQHVDELFAGQEERPDREIFTKKVYGGRKSKIANCAFLTGRLLSGMAH